MEVESKLMTTATLHVNSCMYFTQIWERSSLETAQIVSVTALVHSS